MVLVTIQTIICNLKYHSEIPKIGKSVLIHLTVVYTGCSEKTWEYIRDYISYLINAPFLRDTIIRVLVKTDTNIFFFLDLKKMVGRRRKNFFKRF